MNSIIDKITQAICDFLISLIEGSLSTMFNDVNEKVATIAADVGQTPQGWNASIFSLIQNISQTVILPIAGLIIAFVLCYELITMITEKNNMHDIDTFMFFKYFLKAGVAIYIVTHTFDTVSYTHLKKLDKVLIGGKFAQQTVVNPTVFQKCHHFIAQMQLP